jgi:dCMP deaminase|tara:strand:- start:431 stop:958 length:528 start_codon:yes stop_codon:yes gene_type:complete
MMPREVPPVDDFYMGLAFWVRTRSKDPSTNIGAVLVGEGNLPLGYGYNGPPRQIDDKKVDWSRPAKYPKIIHAEINAIKHSCGNDLTGSTLYVSARPCPGCMIDIVSEGIARVVFYAMKPADNSSMLHNEDDWIETLDIANLGGVELIEFEEDLAGDLNWMQTEMKKMESFGLFD